MLYCFLLFLSVFQKREKGRYETFLSKVRSTGESRQGNRSK